MLRQIVRGRPQAAREHIVPVLEAAYMRGVQWAADNFTHPAKWPVASVVVVWYPGNNDLVAGSWARLRDIPWPVAEEGAKEGAWTKYTRGVKGQWWAVSSGRSYARPQGG